MKFVVCGSIAFDYLMTFPGLYKEHILPQNLDRISVSFLVDHMVRRYGGIGANIAYNLTLLGESPLLVGAAGADFGDYRAWLDSHGVDTSGVLEVADKFTASFFVGTDVDGNQIAFFYIGAMDNADENSLFDLNVEKDDIVIVSPDKPEAMLRHCREAKEIGARLVFDPSQQIPRLTGEQLLQALQGAYALTLNEYEYALLKEKTGYTDQQLRDTVEIVLVTSGEKGSSIWSRGMELSIPCAQAAMVVDPTGVGDAYRAGFLKGLAAMLDLETCGRMGSVSACYAIEQVGTQEHRFSHGDFVNRYQETYGNAEVIAGFIGVPVASSSRAKKLPNK